MYDEHGSAGGLSSASLFFCQPARALSTDVSSIRGSEDDSADTMAVIMLGVEPHHPYRFLTV